MEGCFLQFSPAEHTFCSAKGEMLSPLGEDRSHCSRMPWGDSDGLSVGVFFLLVRRAIFHRYKVGLV